MQRTISCVQLWQAQILNITNRDQKQEHGPGWLSVLKEALARGKGVMGVEYLRVRTVPRIAGSARITDRN